MDHACLHLSGCCTTPSTKERKLVESKLLAKPNPSTTANSPNENDDVINIGEYNIDGAPIESVQTTTSMMTDVVAPSTETPPRHTGPKMAPIANLRATIAAISTLRTLLAPKSSKSLTYAYNT